MLVGRGEYTSNLYLMIIKKFCVYCKLMNSSKYLFLIILQRSIWRLISATRVWEFLFQFINQRGVWMNQVGSDRRTRVSIQWRHRFDVFPVRSTRKINGGIHVVEELVKVFYVDVFGFFVNSIAKCNIFFIELERIYKKKNIEL